LEAGLRFAERFRELRRALDKLLSIAVFGILEGNFQDRLEKLLDDTLNDTQVVTVVRPSSYQKLENIFA
jgi:hypothetical protein